MKRINKIHQLLISLSARLDQKELLQTQGITTEQISDTLGYLRSNVSFDLNKLTEDGMIIKIKKRPVRFIDKQKVEELLGVCLRGPVVYHDVHEILKQYDVKVLHDKPLSESNVFSEMIGCDSSLKNPVEQAKAAVMYPPYGLPTLIIGATGVGKSLFARLMYDYAKDERAINGDFILFNCADYYNNPQLLISHLFGHIKGAFTGATSDKEGLIEKANGGVLFLDEIHRLPPEGQEMVFYTLDSGNFSRLGETERTRTSRFRFICATTEDPESSLLKTFIRRLPAIIHLPSLHARSAQEKLELACTLLKQEALRINKPITIDASSLKSIIGNTRTGNVGQMKSNIQLICASVFMRAIKADRLHINFDDLAFHLKKGIYELDRTSDDTRELTRLIDDQVDIEINSVTGQSHYINDEYELKFNLYRIIEEKNESLTHQGVSKEEVIRYITIDIEQSLSLITKKFDNNETSREKLLRLVSPALLHSAENVRQMVSARLNQFFDDRFLVAFSLHLSAYLESLHNKDYRPLTFQNTYDQIPVNVRNCAGEVVAFIESEYQITVHKSEIGYIALLINALRSDTYTEHVSVMVIMHGSTTATSMVNVVRELLDEQEVYAVDMPLDMSPDVALALVRDKIQKISHDKGVLLLVDMGSLVNFGDMITHDTGIKTRTIPMVSTPLLIEAVRKAALNGSELNDVYNSLLNFHGYDTLHTLPSAVSSPVLLNAVKDRAIVAICSSGVGTAVKLKKLVEDILQESGDRNIQVITLSLANARIRKTDIHNKYNVLFTIGVQDPEYNAPFVSLEKIFTAEGESAIKTLLDTGEFIQHIQRQPAMIRNVLLESLREIMTFLNPHKAVDIIIQFIQNIEKVESGTFSTALKISLGLHVANALERVILNTQLTSTVPVSLQARLAEYQAASRIFAQKIGLQLNDTELAFIIEMIDELYASNKSPPSETSEL
ncbi:sigma 54-interacting transcriptional regulator [Citrobacter freundii]|uniref:sigma-54-dependent transcriptional regulator n=1 Tax=Enterobacter bugandensis TaxID=881260 RepID=UPI00064350D3|nr:sigma-54-dependent transcriptional regulator [Enterobacter bugandensis]ELK6069405.1 sigma 54-interacting transcriptional regulator [Citrobacter freundii]ELK6556134.1 sigma 54-interacting transcriptional regulator [Citrobacter freundii]KLQ30155.1 hypothetical protein ABR33_16105 [Enterobacter bugandensis]